MDRALAGRAQIATSSGPCRNLRHRPPGGSWESLPLVTSSVKIVLEKRCITADTALRLARFFGTSAEMWTGLQADYDLRLARYEKPKQIERDVEPLADLEAA